MQSHLERAEQVVIASVGVALFLTIAAYIFTFRTDPPGGPDSWAQFGEYLGGLANPIVGIATVFLLIRTLRLTRESSARTQLEMQRQLDHLQGQQETDELRRRLDGALAAWNAGMDSTVQSFLRGNAQSGDTYVAGVPNTYRAHLYHPLIINEMTAVAKGKHVHEARVWWNRDLELFIQLLDEFQLYCKEYETRVGSQDLTDYYRRRIQRPLRAFLAIGIVSSELFKSLLVPQTFRDYLQN
jgi:hypothetical protein